MPRPSVHDKPGMAPFQFCSPTRHFLASSHYIPPCTCHGLEQLLDTSPCSWMLYPDSWTRNAMSTSISCYSILGKGLNRCAARAEITVGTISIDTAWYNNASLGHTCHLTGSSVKHTHSPIMVVASYGDSDPLSEDAPSRYRSTTVPSSIFFLHN